MGRSWRCSMASPRMRPVVAGLTRSGLWRSWGCGRSSCRPSAPATAQRIASRPTCRESLPGDRCADIGVLLGIPQRTFARRRKTLLLSPQESDRLYRLARIVSMAAEVLGSQTKARQWLCSPNRALAGEEPLQLLDTDIGARQMEEVLLRMSYGVFS